MDREKTKLEEFEASLEAEEKILEGIRDSLKGEAAPCVAVFFAMLTTRIYLDKTQVFHDQIEVKQKELQPWTSKINGKQAEIDVARSERDELAKKAEAVKEASKEAQENLERLRAELETKVRAYITAELGSHIT